MTNEPIWADVDGVELRLPPGRLPPFCGRKTDSARRKIATSNTERQHHHRADKALRRFSWESGE